MRVARSLAQQSRADRAAPAAELDAAEDLNDAQCLLVQAYVESGGDVADEAQWDAFMRSAANYKYSLPRRQRRVFALAWHAQDDKLRISEHREHEDRTIVNAQIGAS
jgi:hypothetical protein